MKYNNGKKYNFTGKTGGGLYNSAQFVIMVKLFETFHSSEYIKNITVKNIIYEKSNVFDKLTQYALHNFIDTTSMKDESNFSAIQLIAEKLNINDIFDDLIVYLYLKEENKILDRIKEFNVKISQNEKFLMNEKISLDAFVKEAEKLNFKDVALMLTTIHQFEYTRATDRAPRKAISDFLIGYSKGLDHSYEWFNPIEMMYDSERSEIQVMPQTESTYIEMPYMDGSITENTVYKNRFFNIVAWSKDGLSTYQKEQLKSDIVRLLDSTKEKPKKLTFQKSDIAFDVKYSGNAEIKEGPSFVRASFPFEASPYGYPLFDQIIYGTGLILNDGDTDIGVLNIVDGGCKNPSFQIKNIVYKWNGTVPINSKLIIDHERLVCYLEDTAGHRTNAMVDFTGEFQIIPKHTTAQITAFDNTGNYLKTIVKEKLLWRK